MALTDENGMVMPVAPYGGNSGFGDFGGSGWWILLLFLLIGNNGWGGFGGFGGGADMYPWMNNSNQMASGFQNAALQNNLTGLQASINTGFGDLQGTLNTFQSNFAQCCCDNKLAIADLKYTVATENCADRAALSEGVRDIVDASNRNTQVLLDKICALELDAKNDKIVELERQLNNANNNAYLQAAIAAQNQYIAGLITPATTPTSTSGS